MTIEEILKQESSEAIKQLKKKTIKVPNWGELEKQYDKTKHPVTDKRLYPDIIKAGETELVSRVTLGLQKLAVKRMTGLMFGVPARRLYKPADDNEAKAAEIIEDILVRNRIDSVNINRAKVFFSSCEMATIWYAQEQATVYAGEPSKLKLRCKTYSPKDGANIYPLFDDYDDLIALSIEYTREQGDDTKTEYFETFTAEKHIRWAKKGGAGYEEEVNEMIKLGKISGVYAHREEPIWESESENVSEAEWTLSRQGNYIRKNARPTWVEYTDTMPKHGNEPSNSNQGRNILRYNREDRAGYVTWEQSVESIKHYIETLQSNFFNQLQLPRMSFEEMKSVPMSGEARKMMFIDAILKVVEESGVWLEFFSREINVIKAYVKAMYPRLAKAVDSLSVEVEITPFTISSDKEKAEILAIQTGGKPIKSQRTAIMELGDVDNAEKEIEQIKNEAAVDIMNASF